MIVRKGASLGAVLMNTGSLTPVWARGVIAIAIATFGADQFARTHSAASIMVLTLFLSASIGVLVESAYIDFSVQRAIRVALRLASGILIGILVGFGGIPLTKGPSPILHPIGLPTFVLVHSISASLTFTKVAVERKCIRQATSYIVLGTFVSFASYFVLRQMFVMTSAVLHRMASPLGSMVFALYVGAFLSHLAIVTVAQVRGRGPNRMGS